MTPRKAALTLVTGATPAAREQAIAGLAAAPASGLTAILLEGLAVGRALPLPFDVPSEQLQLHRIAAGCLCCTGNLVLRVTLNRILRLQPERLFIGLATTDHLDQLRSWLQQAPYDQLLELTPDVCADLCS